MIDTMTRRADLEDIEVSFPNPFLVEKIAPYFVRGQNGGTLYYQALQDAPTAQVGRNTASLADISSTVIAASTTSFSMQECRARISMSYDQVKGYLNQDAADIAMARMAKRAFYLAIEKECAKALLHSNNPVNGISNPLATIDAEVAKLRDKAYGTGKMALSMSHTVFANLKNNEAIQKRMISTGVIVDGLSPRYVSPEQLAAAFGVDEVLVGADISWKRGVNAADRGNVGLSLLPTPEVDPAEEPQFARTLIFDWGDSAERYILQEFHNPINDSWNMDAVGIIQLKVLNASMATQIQVFAADESSSN